MRTSVCHLGQALERSLIYGSNMQSAGWHVSEDALREFRQRMVKFRKGG